MTGLSTRRCYRWRGAVKIFALVLDVALVWHALKQ